jgi:hypothetical protein
VRPPPIPIRHSCEFLEIQMEMVFAFIAGLGLVLLAIGITSLFQYANLKSASLLPESFRESMPVEYSIEFYCNGALRC